MIKRDIVARALLLLFLLAAFPGQALALDIVPFKVRNQLPLVQIFGLPPAADATLLPAGRTSALLTVDISSNFIENAGPSESLLLDGESYRYSLALRRGIGKDFEVGVEIPYIRHDGGFLDSFIDDWHDTFGLPEGGRDEAPSDRLSYRYDRNGKEEFSLTESTGGLGDIRLSGAWQIHRREGESPRALALHLDLKLPTGDSDRLLGSESTDLALSLAGSVGSRLTLFGSGGILLMTDGEVLEEQQRNAVGFATLGAGWKVGRRLAFKAQLDGHTPFYRDSDLKQLESGSLQLTVGGTVALAEETFLDIGVGEDIDVESAPDVLFHLALRTIF